MVQLSFLIKLTEQFLNTRLLLSRVSQSGTLLPLQYSSSTCTRPFVSIASFSDPRCQPSLTRKSTKAGAESVGTMGWPATQHATLRVDSIGGNMTEILEVLAERPAFQVLFIPGNPGVVAYYEEFVEFLYDHLDGQASVTAIGHIAHASTDWEHGKLFSLEEQINHKVHFLRDKILLKTPEVPVILVGHSIGAYIIMEILKRLSSPVLVIGLYPFVTLNTQSKWQGVLRHVTGMPALCAILSTLADLVGRLPKSMLRGMVKVLLGRTWSSLAVDVTCKYIFKKNCAKNFMFLGRTEFATLPLEPDWDFLRANQARISFLFGVDDHWGPLSLLQQMSKEIPSLHVATEREGHLHAFCCTTAGSDWVARHTANTIFSQKSSSQL